MLFTKRTFLSLSFIVTALPLLFGQELPQAKIDSIIASYISDMSPGVAVGIIQEGEVIYEKYQGYANLEHLIKIDKNTSFNIASNAKQFTALAILQLENEGQLKSDDDIRNYLPELYPNYDKPITITQLITHSSGIRDVYDLWALQGKTWYEMFIDNQDAIALLKGQEAFNFEPGSAYGYSNSNYILLAEIIKRVTKMSFATYTRSLFEQLGMFQTAFLTNYMEVIPNKARPYGNWNGWKEYPSITEIYGDGALFTTPTDQFRWEQLIQQKVSSPIDAKILNASQQPIPDAPTSFYGYGLMFDNYKGEVYSYHDGSTGAYNATFLRFPSRNTAIVIMSNSTNVPTNLLAKRIADVVLAFDQSGLGYPKGPDQIPPAIDRKALLGAYLNKEGTLMKIVEENGQLYRQIAQRDPIALIKENGAMYYYQTNKDLKMVFTENEKGALQLTLYLSSQPPNTFTKINSIPVSEKAKNEISGSYFNQETDTTIELQFLKENSYSVIKNGKERQGQLLISDVLKMNSYQMFIQRDSSGTISGLWLKNGRIDNVWFPKLE